MNMYFFIYAKIKGKLPQRSLRIIVPYSVRASGESPLQHVATDESPLSVSVSKLAACQNCECNRVPFSFFFFGSE